MKAKFRIKTTKSALEETYLTQKRWLWFWIDDMLFFRYIDALNRIRVLSMPVERSMINFSEDGKVVEE